LADFHLREGRIATLVAARVPTRFRVLGLRDDESLVRGFASKSVIQKDFINGGFYCFLPKIFDADYLGVSPEIVLEDAVLDKLARDRQLTAWTYEGPWQHLDSERDLGKLEALAAQSFMPSAPEKA
jgi:glucose-1-phosphate cytidylyltransferase